MSSPNPFLQKRVNSDRRFHAVRAHLFELAGNPAAALEAYRAAAVAVTNAQQQRYLSQQISRLQNSTESPAVQPSAIEE